MAVVHQVKSAFVWSALERFVQQGVQLAIGVLLARLLSPADFGVVGMLSVFFATASACAETGFGSALVQRSQLSEDDTTSCFYLNIAAGVVFAGLLCLVSPLAASFYETPILQPMLCALSLQLVFASFWIVQDALRSRALDFRTLALVSWIATLVAGATAIGLAWARWGVWSLVAMAVIRSLMGTLLLYMYRPWWPRGQFRWSVIRSFLPFSSRMLLVGLLEALFRNLHTVVIGKLYSPAELGYFTRAQQFAETPSQSLTAVVARVSFPYFSRIKDDRNTVRMRLRQFIRLTATVHFPLMVAMAAVAPSLVPALLTDKWVGCIHLLQVLSLVGLLYPLHAFHVRMLSALGRNDLLLRVDIIKRVVFIFALVVTAPLGVFHMTVGLFVGSCVAYWINSYYSRRLLDYSWPQQIQDILPMLITAVTIALPVYALNELPCEDPWIRLGFQAAATLGVFLSLLIIFRRTWFLDALQALSSLPRCPRWVR